MHLHGILRSLAPLIILITYITISIAHPLGPPRIASAHVIYVPLTLIKRTNHVTLSGMTLRGSQSLATILPLQLAAAQFETLYSGLYHTAVSELSHGNYLGGARSFTLQYEALQISFVASDNVAQRNIPWEFVRDFATMMRIMSLRGYTGCYDQGYWNEVGDFGIYVGLRILAPLGLTARV